MLLLTLIIIILFYIGWKKLFNKSKKLTNSQALTISSTSFIDAMIRKGKDTAIIFGSESGTSEYFAQSLKISLQRICREAFVIDPSDWDNESLLDFSKIKNFLVVMIVATYGEGDPTANAECLHEFLNEGGHDLSMMNYAVFGCGNSSYTYYNEEGRFVYRKLESYGATPIVELGLGDSNDNIEGTFIEWKTSLLSRIFDLFELHNVDVEIKKGFRLIEHPPGEDHYRGEISMGRDGLYDIFNPFMAKMVGTKRLGKRGERILFSADFSLADSGLRYSVGDHIGVYPTNDSAIVERIGSLLNTNLDQIFTLESIEEDGKNKFPFPCPTTYRTALLHYVDVCTPLRRDVLQILSSYVADNKDKQFITSLIENKIQKLSKGIFDEWIVSARRSVLDVLEEIPSFRPPVDVLCEVLPRLRPRMYSISSTPRTSSGLVSITAVLVDYVALSGRRIEGVTTSFLWRRVGETVPIFIRRSNFKLPTKPSLPIIMIGPGTGIAPFMGFLRERQERRLKQNRLAKSILFYGCRHKNEDYLYEEELAGMVEDGTLTQLHVAFSRDQAEKIYVQHLIWESREILWSLIEGEKAYLYVCGDAKNMARDVNDTFVRIVSQCGEMSSEEASDYLRRLRQSKRYSCDVWT